MNNKAEDAEREEISTKVIALFDRDANYERGSKERVRLYQSMVKLIESDRRSQRHKLLADIEEKLDKIENDRQGYNTSVDVMRTVLKEMKNE